ncbi:MAG: hypothetical protein LBI84_08520 [Propionibacteriaceae bacterium]|jgi:hypothetical protein|nr:hypothetical protein [Propionibacteriaceae bacterium]
MRKALAGLTAGFLLAFGLVVPLTSQTAQAAEPPDQFCVSYATEMENVEQLQADLEALQASPVTGATLTAMANLLGQIIEAFQRVYDAGAPASVAPEMTSFIDLFTRLRQAVIDVDIDAIADLQPEVEGDALKQRLDNLDQAAQEYCAAPEASASPTADPTASPSSDPTASPTADPTPIPSASASATPSADPTTAPATSEAAAPTATATSSMRQSPYCTAFVSAGAQLGGMSTSINDIGQAQATLTKVIPLLQQLAAASPPPEVSPSLNQLLDLFTRVKSALDTGNLSAVVSMQGEIEAASSKITALQNASLSHCNISSADLATLANTGSVPLTASLGVIGLVALGLAGLSGMAASRSRRHSA